jgi:hypothetical protein
MKVSAIVLGDLSAVDRERLSHAATRAEAALSFQPSTAHALARLRGAAKSASCLLVHEASLDGAIVEEVRDDASLFGLRVIVLAEHPLPATWERACSLGVDDVVLQRDLGGITRRLALLSEVRVGERPAAALGRAVVASADDASRRRIGRTLRSVGFDVEFAASFSESVKDSSERSPRPVFVVTTESPPFELGGLDVAYVENVPVLFLASAEQVHDRVADATARVLFFADEQAKAAFKDRRASARRLFSAMIAFREAGTLEPTYGMTHNVSREGLYVRTLDPPRALSSLWIELMAPGTPTPVHLRARAMWQKLPAAQSGVLPPGFGLRLDPEASPSADLEAFERAYDALG